MLANTIPEYLKPRQRATLLPPTRFLPVEILYAMDLVPMHCEMTTWLTAMFLGDQAELLTAGAELGLAPEICSPHRGLAGAFHLKALPRPNVMLWSNLICDNSAKSGEMIMELNDCPGFFLDRPFQQSKDEVDYFVGELKELITFLECQSGRKMNWDRLSEIVARMDRQIQLLREIDELRKAVPSPILSRAFSNCCLPTICFLVSLRQLRIWKRCARN